MQASKQEYRIGPGASSLLMIFVSLCMTALGVLTLISALNDSNLTKRSELTITAYYDGAALAQQEIARIDGELLKARQKAASVEEYRNFVFSIAAADIELTVDPHGDDEALLSFAAPMYGDHEIFVQMRIPLQLTGDRYSMIGHMLQDTSVWQPDDDLDLYTGESDEQAAVYDPAQEDA